MKILEVILLVFPSILCVGLGVSIKYFKAYWLISGYNTMSLEKKKNVKIEDLGKLMGNFCFILAGFLFIFILFLMLNLIIPAIISVALLVVTIVFLLIYSQRYDGNALNKDGKMKTSTKIIIGAVISFLVLILGGVGILLYQSNLPTTYEISNNSLNIGGIYGETIAYKDINNISLIESLPKIKLRTNGSAIGDTLKGYFDIEELGNVKLFVNKAQPPFILIKTEKRIVILNDESAEKTKKLFERIKQIKGN